MRCVCGRAARHRVFCCGPGGRHDVQPGTSARLTEVADLRVSHVSSV
jgi:hypothetical protein